MHSDHEIAPEKSYVVNYSANDEASSTDW